MVLKLEFELGVGCGAEEKGDAVPIMVRVEFSRIEYADTGGARAEKGEKG